MAFPPFFPATDRPLGPDGRVVRTVFARHVGYTPEDLYTGPVYDPSKPCPDTGTGTRPPVPPNIPVVALLRPQECRGDDAPEFPAALHVAYDPATRPLLAVPFGCCDGIHEERVLPDCAPLAEFPGITKTVAMYLTGVANCLSARGKLVKLAYDAGAEAWYGSVSLRGGTVQFKWSCTPGDPLHIPPVPSSFRLEWWGCEPGCPDPDGTGTGATCSQDAQADCETDPLGVSYNNISLPYCCDCDSERDGLTFTFTTAEVTAHVLANCPGIVLARHIEYTPNAVPVVAMERGCADFDDAAHRGCADVYCGFVATIDASGCPPGCLGGTYDFPSTEGGDWEVAVGHAPCAPALMTMGCVQNCDDTVTYNLVITCGVTNTGTASVTVPAEDVEDLDITFDVPMVDPSAGNCTGNCVFQWNEMAHVWMNYSNDCTPPADCDPCPNGPDDNSDGTVDGEFRSQPCTGSVPPACCIGTLSVRVMR